MLMRRPKELKRMRKRGLLMQEKFAKRLYVAFSTVNRWKQGKSKLNLVAMKKIKSFCEKMISYVAILMRHGLTIKLEEVNYDNNS